LLELILKAAVTGFVLSILLGPVFFSLLEISIRKGVRSAIAFDLGVFASDAIYILIAYVFYSEVASITNGGENTEIAKIIGGSLFIIYGLYTFFKKLKSNSVDEDGKIIQNQKDYILLFLRGFVLNFANPFVIVYWFSVMTSAPKIPESEGGESTSLLIFISIILITFFSFDILKIIGAKKLRPLVTDNILKSLNQLTGIVFFGFGLFLLIKIIAGHQ
jgi:threonine/homoserine/homoserine lactone efflux protein